MLREEAVRFGDSKRLVGVLSRPAMDVRSDAAVVLLNSGIIHRVGPNRLYVELAREITTESGYPVLRFDLAGIGDSGLPRSTALEESVRADIADSLAYVSDALGVSRVVLGGLCSGADNAFLAALGDPRVAGLFLLDPSTFKTWGFHVRRLWEKAHCRVSWMNLIRRGSVLWKPARLLWRRLSGRQTNGDEIPRKPSFYGMSTLTRDEVRRGLEGLVRRRVRLLYIFTGGLRRRYNYQGQFQDAFRGTDFQGCLREVHVASADHTFSGAEHRRTLLHLVTDWLDEAPRPEATESCEGPHGGSGVTVPGQHRPDDILDLPDLGRAEVVEELGVHAMEGLPPYRPVKRPCPG